MKPRVIAGVDHGNDTKESGGSHNPSIAWSCFDRALDSGDQGYNEDAIRGATATIYTGKKIRAPCGSSKLDLFSAVSCGRDGEGKGQLDLFVR